MKESRDYNRTCNMVARLVEKWRPRAPLFAFPHPEVALIASLKDVGQYLARNDAARELVAKLLSETKVLGLPDYPTALMLRMVLEHWQLPIEWVNFDELGIPGQLLRMQRPS